MDQGLAAACSVDGAAGHRLLQNGRLRAALAQNAVRASDDATLHAALVELAKTAAIDADLPSTILVDDLRRLAVDLADGPHATDRAFALALLTECALHHALTGRTASLVDDIDAIVARAAHVTAPAARFRVHRIVFASAFAQGDLQTSSRSAEAAWRAASATGRVDCRFESLLFVVLLLETMGLLRHARDLALDLVRWRAADASLETLHLANATAGLRISQRLDDPESAALFHTTIRDAHESGTYRDPLATAVSTAAMMQQLLWTGRPRPAARLADDVLARSVVHRGARASAILRCAEADVRLAIGEPNAIERSAAAIEALLPRFVVSSPIHQALLRAAVRLDLGFAQGERSVDGSGPFRRYRDRSAAAGLSMPIDFFWWTAAASDGAASTEAARSDDDADDDAEPARFHRSFADLGFAIDDFIGQAPMLSAAENEAARRTPHYELVEGWAVAAEMAAGGTGRQCFKVGRVAATLAAALGFSDERAVMLDMACRLRDFGSAAVDCTAGDDGSRVDARHAWAERARAAERMLAFSDDPALRLARLVATHYRAWWNGSGLPGLPAGADIPIEARVCALADALVEMVDPQDGARRWTIDRAMRQIQCLAGVQFDPTLVGLLARVLRDDGAQRDDDVRGGRVTRATASIVKAKKGLFESLELVDESVTAST